MYLFLLLDMLAKANLTEKCFKKAHKWFLDIKILINLNLGQLSILLGALYQIQQTGSRNIHSRPIIGGEKPKTIFIRFLLNPKPPLYSHVF